MPTALCTWTHSSYCFLSCCPSFHPYKNWHTTLPLRAFDLWGEEILSSGDPELYILSAQPFNRWQVHTWLWSPASPSFLVIAKLQQMCIRVKPCYSTENYQTHLCPLSGLPCHLGNSSWIFTTLMMMISWWWWPHCWATNLQWVKGWPITITFNPSRDI